MKRALLVLAVIGLIALLGAAAATSGPSPKLTILFTGDCRGWIKPCGCAGAEMAGGLMRRATLIQQQRRIAPDLVLVDLGHNFQGASSQEQAKARTLLRSLQLDRYDALTFGKDDFLFGVQFLAEHAPTQFVSSNVEPAGAPPGMIVKRLEIPRSPRPLLILAVTGPDVLYAGEQGSLKIHDPLQAVKQELNLLQGREPRPLVLVLAAVKPQLADEIFALPGVDLLIRSTAQLPGSGVPPYFQVRDNRVLAEVADQGRDVGKLVVEFQPDGRVAAANVEYLLLGDKLADHPEHKRLFEAYQDEVKRIYEQSAAEARLHERNSPFVGSESCMQCHAAAFDAWVETQHAQAMSSLAHVSQDFDPECVGCHSVGYGQQGGYTTMDVTPGLGNVGCEACHGPRKAHAADPQIKGTPANARTCLGCHTALRDPRFEFTARWAKIAHGMN